MRAVWGLALLLLSVGLRGTEQRPNTGIPNPKFTDGIGQGSVSQRPKYMQAAERTSNSLPTTLNMPPSDVPLTDVRDGSSSQHGVSYSYNNRDHLREQEKMYTKILKTQDQEISPGEEIPDPHLSRTISVSLRKVEHPTLVKEAENQSMSPLKQQAVNTSSAVATEGVTGLFDDDLKKQTGSNNITAHHPVNEESYEQHIEHDVSTLMPQRFPDVFKLHNLDVDQSPVTTESFDEAADKLSYIQKEDEYDTNTKLFNHQISTPQNYQQQDAALLVASARFLEHNGLIEFSEQGNKSTLSKNIASHKPPQSFSTTESHTENFVNVTTAAEKMTEAADVTAYGQNSDNFISTTYSPQQSDLKEAPSTMGEEGEMKHSEDRLLMSEIVDGILGTEMQHQPSDFPQNYDTQITVGKMPAEATTENLAPRMPQEIVLAEQTQDLEHTKSTMMNKGILDDFVAGRTLRSIKIEHAPPIIRYYRKLPLARPTGKTFLDEDSTNPSINSTKKRDTMGIPSQQEPERSDSAESVELSVEDIEKTKIEEAENILQQELQYAEAEKSTKERNKRSTMVSLATRMLMDIADNMVYLRRLAESGIAVRIMPKYVHHLNILNDDENVSELPFDPYKRALLIACAIALLGISMYILGSAVKYTSCNCHSKKSKTRATAKRAENKMCSLRSLVSDDAYY